AMPLQLSSPGTGSSFRILPMGDSHVQTPCMRKENVKMFPSVQCIGGRATAGAPVCWCQPRCARARRGRARRAGTACSPG
ncbi:hypothetical protein EK904_013382, partial [Melospiza melodia maxima]